MNKIFRKLTAVTFSALIATAAFTSCDTKEDEMINQQTITLTVGSNGTFTAVAPAENPASTDWKVFAGANYVFFFDFVNNSCSIGVTDLKVDDSTTPLTFTMNNLPQSRETDENVRGVDTAGPVAFQGPDGRTHVVKDIRLACLRDPERYFDNANSPVPTFFMSFILDDTQIKVMPNNEIYFGTTRSHNLSNTSETYENTTAKYLVTFNMYDPTTNSFNPSRLTADISILYPSFSPGMPDFKFPLIFPEVTFTLNENGCTFAATTLTPKMQMTANSPITDVEIFPITDLSATMVYEKSFNLSFDCISKLPKVGSWHVDAETTPFALKKASN